MPVLDPAVQLPSRPLEQAQFFLELGCPHSSLNEPHGPRDRATQGRNLMTRGLLGAVLALILASPALAQSTDQSPTGNLEKLSSFRSTGTVEPKPIPQEGRKADALRRILQQVKLPPGFKIELYAVVPDARHMAVGPNAGVVFVGTRKNNVYVVTDRDKDRVADEVKQFAPSVEFKIPNGVCFSRDGMLYVVEQNRVLLFPAAEFFYEGPDVVAVPIVKQGDLIPPAEESYNHTARVCRVGPDNKLYISLGQPYNVPPKEKLDLYAKVGIGGIIRMDQDGKNREVYVRGIRNSVGMDQVGWFAPRAGERIRDGDFGMARRLCEPRREGLPRATQSGSACNMGHCS